MPASISINPFPLSLCFHIDCACVILIPKLFCRDIVVFQDFQFFQLILEFFTNIVLKASDLHPLYGLLKAQVFALHRHHAI